MRHVLLGILALVMALAFLPTASAQSTNLIRVIHASPDAPNVDIYVNGSRVLADVPFFATSPYLPLADGAYDLAIVAAGANPASPVWAGVLEVQGGYTGTVAALNRVSNLEVFLYDDELTPLEGLARVNIIHASPDAPAVDIKLAGTGTVIAGGVPFTDGGVLEVEPGSYRFDISAAGSPAVAFTTPELVFLPGWTYTLVATGLFNEGGFWVQSRVDNYITEGGVAALSSNTGTGRLTSR